MTSRSSQASVRITKEEVVHFLANILDSQQFAFHNLEVNQDGLSGYAIDASVTLYCEFTIPSTAVEEFSPGFSGTITVPTEDLEALVASAASHFPQDRSSLTFRLSTNGIQMEYEVTKTLVRRKRVGDVPAERQRRLNFEKLASAAEAAPTSPKFLALAGSTFGRVDEIQASIDEEGLHFGPTAEDRLTLNVKSRGRASTRVLERIFKVMSRFVQAKDPPEVVVRIVDGGILGFEARSTEGPLARYVVTRAAAAD